MQQFLTPIGASVSKRGRGRIDGYTSRLLDKSGSVPNAFLSTRFRLFVSPLISPQGLHTDHQRFFGYLYLHRVTGHPSLDSPRFPPISTVQSGFEISRTGMWGRSSRTRVSGLRFFSIPSHARLTVKSREAGRTSTGWTDTTWNNTIPHTLTR